MIYTKNLGQEILDIESKMFHVPGRCYNHLDDLVKAARNTVDENAKPKDILRSMDAVLEDKGIAYNEDSGCLFSRCILKKEFDHRLSYLYLAIADALELPIDGVMLPANMFVRYNNGGSPVNWDMKLKKPLPDNYYKFIHNIHDKSVNNGVYLRNLERKEAAANWMAQVGVALDRNGREKEALSCFSLVARFFPKSVTAHYNKGKILSNLGYWEKALKSFDKVIELDPNFSEAYNKKGITLKEMGERKLGKENIRHAEKLKNGLRSRKARMHLEKGREHYNRGDRNAALEDFACALSYDKSFIKQVPIRCIPGLIKSL